VGSKERRDRERSRLREKILDTARELFATEGYDAVTMRRIAELIEYSPTAIYLHFKDKDELVRELVTADFAAFAALFQKVLEQPDLVERLREAGRVYVRFGLEHPHHYHVLFEAPLPDPPIDHPTTPDADGYFFLRHLVADAMAAGKLREDITDADRAAQVLWAGVHGITSLVLARHGQGVIAWRDRDVLVEDMLELLMRGTAR
jgi:AcrR family transcriptional regulator